MGLIVASLVGAIAALGGGALLLMHRQRGLERRQGEMLRRLDELESSVGTIRRDLESLKAVRAAESNRRSQTTNDPLALIEQLAESAALSSDETLQNIIPKVTGVPPGVAADLFEADRKLLAISRLIENGHPLPEIARRLNLPLGEVEFLVSLRS